MLGCMFHFIHFLINFNLFINTFTEKLGAILNIKCIFNIYYTMDYWGSVEECVYTIADIIY